ncbi:copper resistance protein CopC [Mesorhizobium sp. CAU 1732]|uniref:copper resistance CopC/CopD family protein n=1 Tax=Mesorhizobium sp. CAU 1732 TaxID=3140358 RepID=UPI0032618CA4
MRGTWRAAARMLALCLMIAGAMASEAAAHASLTGTDPVDGAVVAAAPQRFTISFSEPVSPLTLQVIRPDGEAVPLDRFAVRDRSVEIEAPADLSDGTHVLTWRVVSSDGHPVGGSVIFSIGAPSAAPPPIVEPMELPVRAGLLLTRVGLYLGLFFGVGGAFAIAVFFPQSRSGARAAMLFVLLGALATAASPGFQGLDALGAPLPRYLDPLMWSTGLSTSYGRTVFVLLGAFGLALVAVLVRTPWVSRACALAGLVAAAVAMSLSGHAGAAEPQWLTRPSVALHVATIAVWVGALIPLGQALRTNAADASAGLARFSTAIPFAVAVLIAAGVALTIIQVETPSALIETAYGRLLLAKLGCLALLFTLAIVNRWRLTAPAVAGGSAARSRLTRSIGAETVVVLIIFAIAAGWRFTPPPRALAIAAAQPASMHIHTADAMADLTVSPGRTGPVTVSAVIMTGEFGPLDAKDVTFVFSNPGAGIEPFRRKASKPGDGTWLADDVVLPLAGTWTVRLDILITDFEMTRISGEIQIRP